jgi:hypothetical protein
MAGVARVEARQALIPVKKFAVMDLILENTLAMTETNSMAMDVTPTATWSQAGNAAVVLLLAKTLALLSVVTNSSEEKNPATMETKSVEMDVTALATLS